MSTLRTRCPTGQVAWPLILVEGPDKSGKSVASYSLSADPRVGRTFVLDLGEGSADEYARLGPYEVIDHNGTYSDMVAQIEAACAEPRVDPAKPNVVEIDSGSEFWDLLKDWTNWRARNSKSGKRRLQQDPDAEIKPPMNLWNDARDRWYRVINILRRSDVIGVITCRAREVAKVENGEPVANQTDYKVECEKGTPFAMKAQVRMTKPHTATLVAVGSLDVQIPEEGLRLPDENPLGHLVFDVLGCTPAAGGQRITHGTVGISIADGKNRLLDLVRRTGNEDGDAAKQTAGRLWARWVPGKPDEISPDDLAAVLDKAAAWLERSTKPVGVSDVAIRAGEVFAPHGETAPKGRKTKVVDGLRHALVLELTSGKSSSLNDLNPGQLRAVSGWLDDIADDQIGVAVDHDKGVTFTWVDGSTSDYTWVDLEPIDGAKAKQAHDDAAREMAG